MPRTCTICRHRKREEIERALLKGEPLRAIAKRSGISPTALWRHKDHVSEALTKSVEATEMAHAGHLADQLKALIADAQRLKRQAERKRDITTALKAIRELCRLVELAAKVSGDLDERPQHNELHVHVPEDVALRIAETFVARHSTPKALPDAQVIESSPAGT